MTSETRRHIINFVWFQAIWLLAILFQYEYLWLIGLLLFSFFIFSDAPRCDAVLIIGVLITGMIVDSALTLAGVFTFEQPNYGLPIPWWLLALWAGFAGTLRHSLGYFRQHFWLSVAGGAIFGPISYAAGARLGAVEFEMGMAVTMLILSPIWAVVFPFAVWLSKRAESVWTSTPLTSETKQGDSQ